MSEGEIDESRPSPAAKVNTNFVTNIFRILVQEVNHDHTLQESQ
jgi:hypothetical protein